MEEGIIIRGISGFYYVKTNKGLEIECKARGIFRKNKITPMVGDYVIIDIIKDNMGLILEIKPRKNQLTRPVVANVDQAILVFSINNPQINFDLLNKLILMVEKHSIECTICINKSDLHLDTEIKKIREIYESIGYKVIETSAAKSDGICELKKQLKGKLSAFAGPSGVGKSTLFNGLQNKLIMETGEISKKNNRGKHTTRYTELLEIEPNTFIVDTPGFSNIELDFLTVENLQYWFREFKKYIGECGFTSCIHNKENNCRIKEAVEKGNIPKERYNTYIEILNELQNNRRYTK